MMCRCLDVSRSGFHAWRVRPECARRVEDRKLTALVHAAYRVGRTYYGSPRIHRELTEQGLAIGRNRVIRLMQQENLVGRARRRYRPTTMSDHDQPIAP